MTDSIRADVDFLCSEGCAGRKTGSAEGARARRFLVERFDALGLAPVAPGFVQRLPNVGGGNVVGLLPGRSERTILVAAHYDHLGREGPDAYWGADDNAAAVSILLDVARRLQSQRLGRRILFCAFDAEEPPHFAEDTMGSSSFVRDPIVPLESIDMMVCMDLMGHAVGSSSMPKEVRESVFVLGAERCEGVGQLVESASARTQGVTARRLGIDVVPPLSDYYPFALRRVPNLFLTCGRWAHYHTVHDTPDKLDFAKIASSAELLSTLVIDLAERPEATRYDPSARDDRVALASVGDLGRMLSAHAPRLSEAQPMLDHLAEAVERDGNLKKSDDRELLAALVSGLEATLSSD